MKPLRYDGQKIYTSYVSLTLHIDKRNITLSLLAIDNRRLEEYGAVETISGFTEIEIHHYCHSFAHLLIIFATIPTLLLPLFIRQSQSILNLFIPYARVTLEGRWFAREIIISITVTIHNKNIGGLWKSPSTKRSIWSHLRTRVTLHWHVTSFSFFHDMSLMVACSHSHSAWAFISAHHWWVNIVLRSSLSHEFSLKTFCINSLAL